MDLRSTDAIIAVTTAVNASSRALDSGAAKLGLCLPAGAIADDTALAREAAMGVNKIIWAQAGRVTEPGRYMFKFGWLTITADDLAVWQAYPNAAFTLISATAPPPVEGEEQLAGEEFRLGIFELPIDSNYSDNEK
jgi:hypothetical protein